MNHIELFRLFGPAWSGLPVYEINGVPHWVGCEVVSLLGIKNITNAIKGTPGKPKLTFPTYRMHKIPQINSERSVYMLTFEGVIRVIRMNRSPLCRQLQAVLAEVES